MKTTTKNQKAEGDCSPASCYAFAVTRHWKDNPNDFQVLEYFSSVEECQAYIDTQKKDHRYEDKISSWA
jgi:hypothetical protein